MPPSTQSLTTDRMGYWGNITSTIDWCEYNHEVTPYIAEFWNTISNLWFIIPPLYGISQVLRKGAEKRFLFAYASVAVIGIGSWLFHMTLKFSMQLMDEIPMVFTAAGLAFCIHEVNRPPGQANKKILLALLSYCVIVILLYLHNKDAVFHEVMFGILVAWLMFLDLRITWQDPVRTNAYVCWTGIAMYVLGFLFWIMDNKLCPALRTIRASSSVPETLKPLSQFHAWWHSLVGYSSYLQIVLAQRQRLTYLGTESNYTIGPMGLDLSVNYAEKKKKLN